MAFYYRIKVIIKKILDPKYSKSKFLKIINNKGKLLDVGCGNNSPYQIKTQYPNLYYTGIDIDNYNQSEKNFGNEYIITSPERFAETIANLDKQYDTVLSSHNLEHCNDREKTLDGMINILKSGGYFYLSFPTAKSINFPGPREGCLNYFDDPTHKGTPPDFDKIIEYLKTKDMEIIFSSKSYKPFFLYIIGFFMEFKSRKEKRNKIGTWEYWGFESIIWAIKK